MSIILIIIFVLPNLAIYYFTNGNWPLAFKIQIGYVATLMFATITLLISVSQSGGGRGNQIGALGEIFLSLLFLIPMVLCIGGIALFYRGRPAGDPGFLNPFIKVLFLSIGVGLVLLGIVYIIEWIRHF